MVTRQIESTTMQRRLDKIPSIGSTKRAKSNKQSGSFKYYTLFFVFFSNKQRCGRAFLF